MADGSKMTLGWIVDELVLCRVCPHANNENLPFMYCYFLMKHDQGILSRIWQKYYKSGYHNSENSDVFF